MQSMNLIHKILILLFGLAISLQAVPPVLNYAGQVAVNGEAFDGNGLFKFALVNTDGNATYWSNDGTSVNGSEPQASVKAPVSGGLYSLLLGNTAIPGMGAINPTVFAQHSDAKLRVWFSDGVNGFQQLSPDRPFASVPYAFSAGTAQSAGSANIANGSISLDMLSQDVKSQINAPIGLNRLSAEVTAKLDQNGSGVAGVVAGSLISVPYGQSAPLGYSLYQQGTPKELVWEEKAPVSVARHVADGCAVLNGKIYFAGGKVDSSTRSDIMEEYDPATNIWRTLSPLSSPREGVSLFTLQDKLFAIGGDGVGGRVATVETFYPQDNIFSEGPTFPHAISYGNSIELGGLPYLLGGNNQGKIATNYVFENNASTWVVKAPMSKARSGQGLVVYEGHIWAMGGGDGSNSLDLVESYDPVSNSWQLEPSLPVKKQWASAWVANGKIYIAGGRSANNVFESSIHSFSRETGWVSAGNLPENKYAADAVILNDKVYIIAGQTASGVYSNKVYAADLNASVAGVYDLYRKDGNASAGTPLVQAEVADGAITTDKLNEQILKYLKPEITTHPQAQTVFADTNATCSVTAEGKYLTYQWKKDGVDLTGETNSTLTITDANATLHDGNYSVVVSNDFGSVESDLTEVLVKDAILNGLVGWWKFDEGSGTVAYDSSGNGHDGNLTNGPTWVAGKIGGALSFDGVNDHVIAHNFLGIGGSNPRSISAWIKTVSSSSGRAICAFGKYQTGQKWGLRVNDFDGNEGAFQH